MPSKENRKKVLVMDDENMVGDIACQILNFIGFDADWVANGFDAIKKYSDSLANGKPYTAIIMDLTVPGGMGGKEAVSEILAIDKDAKVYVSSGYSNDPVMVNYKMHGFAGVIAKPFDLTAMRETLTPLL